MSWFEHIAELLARDVDMELVRQQLALTPTERLQKLEAMRAFTAEARRAGAAAAQGADRRTR